MRATRVALPRCAPVRKFRQYLNYLPFEVENMLRLNRPKSGSLLKAPIRNFFFISSISESGRRIPEAVFLTGRLFFFNAYSLILRVSVPRARVTPANSSRLLLNGSQNSSLSVLRSSWDSSPPQRINGFVGFGIVKFQSLSQTFQFSQPINSQFLGKKGSEPGQQVPMQLTCDLGGIHIALLQSLGRFLP